MPTSLRSEVNGLFMGPVWKLSLVKSNSTLMLNKNVDFLAFLLLNGHLQNPNTFSLVLKGSTSGKQTKTWKSQVQTSTNAFHGATGQLFFGILFDPRATSTILSQVISRMHEKREISLLSISVGIGSCIKKKKCYNFFVKIFLFFFFLTICIILLLKLVKCACNKLTIDGRR